MSIRRTEKQRLFIENYIQSNGNGTQAALVAFNCKNRKSAASLAYKLLNKPVILAEMAQVAQQKGDDVVVEFALEILRDLDKPSNRKSVDCYIRTILKRIEGVNMAKCDRCKKEMEVLICDECMEEAIKGKATKKKRVSNQIRVDKANSL